jgi:hypothetical protein
MNPVSHQILGQEMRICQAQEDKRLPGLEDENSRMRGAETKQRSWFVGRQYNDPNFTMPLRTMQLLLRPLLSQQRLRV